MQECRGHVGRKKKANVISIMAGLFYLIIEASQMKIESARGYVHWFVLQKLFGLIWPDNHVISVQGKMKEASCTRRSEATARAWQVD